MTERREHPDKGQQPARHPGLDRAIRRTRLSIAAERFVRAFWPVWTTLFLLFAVVRLEILSLLPDPLRLPAVALGGILAAAFIVRGILRFRMPARAEAEARIDDALPGRPIRALSDSQATGREDPGARAVWAAHMARVAARALSARAAKADLRLAAFDTRALRYAAGALFVAALIFGRGEVTEQVSLPVAGPAEASMQQGPVLEAWASPPAYTGKPTLYLTDLSGTDPIVLPAGTRLTLRLYGAETVGLTQDLHSPPAGPVPFAANDQGFHHADFPADASGTLAVSADGRELASWSFTVLPDSPPSVRLTEPPERTVQGTGKYTYEGEDDYGIVAAWATVTLDMDRLDRRYGLKPEPEPREAISFDLPLPLTGDAGTFTETQIVDLSTHPWADLPVTITLHARDAAMQEVTSEPYAVTLPGRRFYDPLAAALVEQRRDLLWSVENAARVGRLLKAATHDQPEGSITPKAHLVIRTAIRRLDYARADGREAEVRDEVAELLWRAALLIEDGDIADALERLRRAQERLSQALEEGATDEEIAGLMDELRQAMQEYLQELMRQALENMENQDQQDQSAEAQPNMSTQDLQEMLDRLQQLMEEGRTAEAQELLRQLQQMMENLQMTMRPGQPQNGPGQQMMEGLQDLMRQQQELGDRTFEELQRQFGQGQQPGQPQPGQPGPGELSRQQEALRQLLEQFRQGMPQMPGQQPGQPGEGDPMADALRSLEEAERNMGEARDRLGEGDPGGAVDDQAEALDALREGMRNLSEAQRQAQQDGPQNGTETSENPGQQRDPLGRPVGDEGQIDGSDVEIPGTEAWKRSRELREEILRRSGEQDRPKLELDYLRRLLERF